MIELSAPSISCMIKLQVTYVLTYGTPSKVLKDNIALVIAHAIEMALNTACTFILNLLQAFKECMMNNRKLMIPAIICKTRSL